MIKEITVPELPPDPANYLSFLQSENLFETASYSSDDKDRTKQYQAEFKRKNLEQEFVSIDDYLKNLEMVGEAKPFEPVRYSRIAQLTQRSNQFNLRTIRYTEADIERIANIFEEKDKVERIYINFCNPWPRGKHHKKRLTHIRQLEKYKQFLINGGKIYFKTDDGINYFKETGFNILKYTYDLQKEPDFWNNIKTEHEDMFIEQGIKIKALIAEKLVADK